MKRCHPVQKSYDGHSFAVCLCNAVIIQSANLTYKINNTMVGLDNGVHCPEELCLSKSFNG